MGSVMMTPSTSDRMKKDDDLASGRIAADDHADAHQHGNQRQHDIDRVLRRQAPGLGHDALQLGEGDAGTGEGHGTDQGTKRGQRGEHDAVHPAARELERRNGSGGTAAHAVVDGDHLRHVGHLDHLAGPPGKRRRRRDGDDHEPEVLHARGEEGDQRGHHHADAGPDDALARRHRRRHGLEAEDEKDCDDEIGCVDEKFCSHVVGSLSSSW
jgi:hypothetical protein